LINFPTFKTRSKAPFDYSSFIHIKIINGVEEVFGMKIGYARVSTIDQSVDMQMDALNNAGCERIYTEKASGAKDDRKELQRALDSLRQGDVFVVYKLDRLARSTKKLIEVYELLTGWGVELVSICDGLETTTPTGRAMFKMIGVIAELEREMMYCDLTQE
jgi:DNA invertase Pin-like site-specific DNA recombinase